jgi:hypothetical protein
MLIFDAEHAATAWAVVRGSRFSVHLGTPDRLIFPSSS